MWVFCLGRFRPGTTEDQRAILRIANLEVEVRTLLTLKPGERLLLSVIKGGRLAQMLLLGEEAAGGGVEARALRAILPRQPPLGLLLERLRSLLSDPSATASRPSAAEAHRPDGSRQPTTAPPHTARPPERPLRRSSAPHNRSRRVQMQNPQRAAPPNLSGEAPPRPFPPGAPSAPPPYRRP
ncbi:MAG: hypothetical protein AB2813_00860 [Candidatus Sedimenticola endophacoides]